MSDRLKLLENMLTGNPEDSFLLFAYAKEYEKLNRLEESLSVYRKLVVTNPRYVGTYYHLGKLLEKNEQFEQAIQVYSDGMDMAKLEKNQHAWSELAGAKMNLVDE
jgi:tetratricopeptide (TPR) repeat protein